MDIQQLKYFVAVCETMNYTRAAESLYVSRQAVSQSVKQLENELAAELILAENGRLTLTPLGTRIYHDARDILGEFEQFTRRVHGYLDRQTGSLRVLTGAAVMTNFPPDLLLRFNTEYHDIMLSVTEADNREMRRTLDSHQADICLMGTSSSYLRDYRYTLLKEQVLTILVHQNNPLAQKDVLTIEDLRDQPMIGHGEAYDLHRFYVDACHDAGFEPSFSMISTNVDLILLLLEQNRAITFGTQDPSEPQKKTLNYCVSIPLKLPYTNFHWGIYAVTSKEHPLRELQKLFLRFLEDQK